MVLTVEAAEAEEVAMEGNGTTFFVVAEAGAGAGADGGKVAGFGVGKGRTLGLGGMGLIIDIGIGGKNPGATGRGEKKGFGSGRFFVMVF